MSGENIPKAIQEKILVSQKSEITEYHIYKKLANVIGDPKNKLILKNISTDELKHHDFWQQFTKTEVKPDKWKIFKYFWVSRIFGITFGLKLMEKGEEEAQMNYDEIAEYIPGVENIITDENKHEKELINLLNEKRLSYIGSIVLGLNDALVELTGTLAGLTFALQNPKIIGAAGLITGIAASFSMAASEYLSQKAEKTTPNVIRAAIYTGIAYLITVTLLILPYLLLDSPFISLGVTLTTGIIIIFLFNLYISIAKEYDFKKRFFEMAGLSLGVALLSFGVGYAVRIIFGVDL
ncbi:VIT1/CCC1 transporter family protein [Pseudomonadota bacterium]